MFGRPAIRRSAARLSADVIGRGVQLGVLVIVARQIDEATFGLILLGSAAGLIMAQMVDLGLQLTVAGDVARRRPMVATAISSALTAKVLLTVGALPLALVLFIALGADRAAGGAGLVAAALCLDSFIQFSATTLRAASAFWRDWVVAVVPRLVTAAVVVPAAVIGQDPVTIGAAWLIGALASACFAVAVLANRISLGSPARDVARDLLLRSWPIGLAILVGMVYTRIGLFTIEWLRSSSEVAVYGVASRLMEPSYLVPAAGAAIFFPSYSRTLQDDPANAGLQLRRWLLAIAAVGIATYLGLAIAGPFVVDILFGPSFATSGDLLAVLALVVVPGFVSYLLNQALIAEGHARYTLSVMGALLVFSAVGTVAAVSAFGIWGAAAVSVGIEILLFVALLRRYSLHGA